MEEDKEEKFRLTVKMTKEHHKLYMALLIITYIIFFPFVLLIVLFEKLGELGDFIGSILWKARTGIIKLVFKCIYKKNK